MMVPVPPAPEVVQPVAPPVPQRPLPGLGDNVRTLAPPARLPWIRTAHPGVPYFMTERGEPWTPIGHNDAISWPSLMGLYNRKGWRQVDAYLGNCARHGVNTLRLMLEYSQQTKWHLETPDGQFRPVMVRLWDDLIALCELHGIRLLLTPLDTFWMMRRWRQHPYNKANGGPCAGMRGMLTCTDTRARILDRLAFATDRWGGSGVIFAWDLWNELDPKYAGGDASRLSDWVGGMSDELRRLELTRHGRAHLQVVSLFSPTVAKQPSLMQTAFAHPKLDFASNHLYGMRSISDPRNTVAPAYEVGQMVQEGIGASPEGRPFLDTEHGPIFYYMNRGEVLPEPFDDEMFGHMQWAHLASGGVGGGMRWPYRRPQHVLTPGMHRHQLALSKFVPLVDWTQFRRACWNGQVQVSKPQDCQVFACGDGAQAVVYLLRNDLFNAAGQLSPQAQPLTVELTLPTLPAGRYAVTAFDPQAGVVSAQWSYQQAADGPAHLALPELRHDLMLAVRRAG